jgi:hypothetical protein
MRGQPDIEGKEDGSDLGHAIVSLEESMAVVSQIGDSIPSLNPHLQKSVGESVDPFTIGAIGKPMISADHASLSPIEPQGPLQKTYWS